MDDMDRAMIRLLAKHSLNVSDVAREICYHRNSVVYRIQRIKKETGKDPMQFYDLIELLNMTGGVHK